MLVRPWASDSISLTSRSAKLFKFSPTVGIVIGTYASVPYIHLQLEARRRFFSHIPCLIHDDASHKINELASFAKAYDCDFEYNSQRQPPCLGDLSVFVGGLRWAKEKNLELLLKVSRRWIFRMDWTESLARLALNSQYATFCSYTTTFNFGFRTECMGMAVSQWGTEAFLTPAAGTLYAQKSVFVEGYLHNFARVFESCNTSHAEAWRLANPMSPDKNGYALWDLMGTDRCKPSENFLWHDFSRPIDYFKLSQSWGLPYAESCFNDPNQGGRNKR